MDQQTVFLPRSAMKILLPFCICLTAMIGCGGGGSGGDPIPETDRELSGQENPSPSGDTGDLSQNEEPSTPGTATEPESESPSPAPESETEPQPALAPPPTNFRVELEGNTAIFQWDPVEGAEKYTLYIAEEQGITPQNYASYRGGKMLDNVTSPFRHLLPRGRSYYAIVTATVNGSEGTPSAEVGIRIQAFSNSEALTLVSMSADGGILPKSKGGSQEPTISYYGRYVAFSSFSDKVVPGDGNGAWDVFLHDRKERKTVRVSVASNGEEGNGNSRFPSISGDGRFIVFQSAASNLVEGDTNGVEDIFLHDRETGTTRRISVAGDGTEANGRSDQPVISSDGGFVAFRSAASNLVEGDTNGKQDIFLYERATGKVTRVSVSSNGEQGNDFSGAPSISADGRYVAFRSEATNLHPKGVNEDPDILVHDRITGETEMVSLSSEGRPYWGKPGNPSISADGRYVVFQSTHEMLIPGYMNWKPDIFLHDRHTGKTSLVPPDTSASGQGKPSANPSISADGRFIVFQAERRKLLPDSNSTKQDVFLHDRESGQTIRISVTNDGEDGNKWATRPVISGDGNSIVFQSTSSNLVEGDDNGTWDIFVFDRRNAGR